MNYEKLLGLQAVILYGSSARKDSDIDSDIDVFVLVDDSVEDKGREEIIESVALAVRNKIQSSNEVNVSLYTSEIFKKMLKEGSLFLWHLKLEGNFLYSESDKKIFNTLIEFHSYEKNIILYEQLFLRCKESLNTNGINSFDLSMLFFLCRNLSILTCYKINKPNFGRISAYKELVEHLKFEPIPFSDYMYLSKWRIDYTRGIEEELTYPSFKKIQKIIDDVESLFSVCKKILLSEVNYGKH